MELMSVTYNPMYDSLSYLVLEKNLRNQQRQN